MAITIEQLRAAAARPRERLAKSLNEARQLGLRTAFLCHSHNDHDLVMGTVSLLRDAGWKVYVDWEDTSMPATPNRETAQKIKDRIKAANYFLFLATPNSMASRWCPWEIGHADGVKNLDCILVIPTRDQSGLYYGNEYLQLYRKIDITSDGGLGVWMPGQEKGVHIRTL